MDKRKKYRLTSRSKDDYLHCLRTIDSLGMVRKSAKGDEWNCKFEIIFSANVIPNVIVEKINRQMVKLEEVPTQ